MSTTAPARRCRPKPQPREGDLRPTDVVGATFVSALAFLVAAAVSGIVQWLDPWPWGRWLALHLAFVGGVSQLVLGASLFFAGADPRRRPAVPARRPPRRNRRRPRRRSRPCPHGLHPYRRRHPARRRLDRPLVLVAYFYLATRIADLGAAILSRARPRLGSAKSTLNCKVFLA